MDKIPYRGTYTWLPEHTLYLVRHGSQAYGTALTTSDEDFKGFAIPPLRYYLGFLDSFEQAEGQDPDIVVYELRKFFALAADCNPSIIEVLWVDTSDWVICRPLAEKILEKRAMFLSRKAKHTFSGYAMSQLRRIKGHYRWLKEPPKAPPTRGELGLPERTVIPADQLEAAMAAIQKKLDSWEWKHLEHVDPSVRVAVQNSMAEVLAEMALFSDERGPMRAAARAIGYDENFIQLLDRERQYHARRREWEQYQEWKQNRNPGRAALEARFGYDTKHAMHLVRLMRMCREILSTGQVIVKRPDRDELLAIRDGAWKYERLLEWAESEDKRLEELYKSSPLPRSPDRHALETLCVEVIEEWLDKGSQPQKNKFAKLRGIATVRMTTDEIMALTRGDE